jgi:hypothetical protein
MGGERDKKENGLLMPDSADQAKKTKRVFTIADRMVRSIARWLTTW